MKIITLFFLTLEMLHPIINPAAAVKPVTCARIKADDMPKLVLAYLNHQFYLYAISPERKPDQAYYSHGEYTIGDATVTYYCNHISFGPFLFPGECPFTRTIVIAADIILTKKGCKGVQEVFYGREGNIETSVPQKIRYFGGEDGIAAYKAIKNRIDRSWMGWTIPKELPEASLFSSLSYRSPF